MSPLASAVLTAVGKLGILLTAKPSEKQPTGISLDRMSSESDFYTHRPSSGARVKIFGLAGSQLSYL